MKTEDYLQGICKLRNLYLEMLIYIFLNLLIFNNRNKGLYPEGNSVQAQAV